MHSCLKERIFALCNTKQKTMKSIKIGDLTIRIPIIQGGMGVGISLSGLASAVANEGGVGVISCAGIGLLYPKFSKDYLTNSIMGLKEELRKARERSRGVIGVNIMVALSNFSDMVRTSIAEKADIIFRELDYPSICPPTCNATVRPNWFPLFRRRVRHASSVKSGKRVMTTCPMPLWWRGPRPEVTSGIVPSRSTMPTIRSSTSCRRW